MQSDLHETSFPVLRGRAAIILRQAGDANGGGLGCWERTPGGKKSFPPAAFAHRSRALSSSVLERDTSQRPRVKTRNEISAGGVIYRPGDGEPEVCLIATQGGKAWQLPKGLIERGEQPEEAARRELAEETGLQGKLLQRLDRIEYWYVWDEDGERVRI